MGVDVIIPLGPAEPLPTDLLDQLAGLDVTLSATTPPPASLNTGLNWVSGSAGRAAQLNRAIAQTDKPWLWIIHADSQLDAGAVGCIQAFCQTTDESCLGYGALQFNDDGPLAMRLNQWGANLRSRWWGQPYGDQALCIHRRLWQALGGFSQHLARGEDLDFVIRARAVGGRLQRLPFTITTSARRYRTEGWLATTLNHQLRAHRLVRQAKRWRP